MALNCAKKIGIIGVVLAGGLSTRMGQDKAQLSCGKSGLTLLQRAEQLLAQIAPAQILVSNNQSLTGIKDVFPQCGPMSGIHASCMAIKERFPEITEALFIPVDMPFLNEDDIAQLINTGSKQQRPCCYANCYLPLYLPINPQIMAYLHNTLLSKGNYSLKKMLRCLNGLQIRPDKSQHLRNINEPHEWQDCKLNAQLN